MAASIKQKVIDSLKKLQTENKAFVEDLKKYRKVTRTSIIWNKIWDHLYAIKNYDNQILLKIESKFFDETIKSLTYFYFHRQLLSKKMVDEGLIGYVQKLHQKILYNRVEMEKMEAEDKYFLHFDESYESPDNDTSSDDSD